MQKEARATEGLRTLREYADISGISYEAVRKKVETHLRRYALKSPKMAAAKIGETFGNEIPEEEAKEFEELKAFYNGVIEINGTKYLDEAAQAYLDRQRRETVVTVPDRDSKAALQVVKEESEALRRQILNLQESLLNERTEKLEDLKATDRTAIEDATARLKKLENRVDRIAEIIDKIDEDQTRLDILLTAAQEAEKADFQALSERIDNLYTDVLKSRKRGLFGRITGE